MLLDRLGRRIEAGSVIANISNGSVRVVRWVKYIPDPNPRLVEVSFLIMERGNSVWGVGVHCSRIPIPGEDDQNFLEIIGNIYASVCEHDYDDALDWLHPHSVSMCLRCGYVRNNTPPLS